MIINQWIETDEMRQVLAYDPNWPVIFKKVKEYITKSLPNLSIEHIGSTAVPGLKSKHMIDLLVIVSNQNLQVVKKSLIGLGFHERDIWIDTEEKPYVGGSLVLGNKPKITHIPDWVRVAILKLVRLLAGSKIYGPVEFFMTVMAMDMVAPEYGKHTLKEHFTNLNKAYA